MLKNKVNELMVLSIASVSFIGLGILTKEYIIKYFTSTQIIFLIGIIFLILAIVLIYLSNGHNSNLEIQINRFENVLKHLNLDKEIRYFTTEELIEFEKKIDKGEVIVFSPEIPLDIEDPFRSMIKGNIKKGIKYKYILPDTVNIRGQYNGLKREFEKELNNIDDRLTAIYLPERIIVQGITLYTNINNEMGVINVPNKEFEKKIFLTMDTKFFDRTKECINEMIKTFGGSER